MERFVVCIFLLGLSLMFVGLVAAYIAGPESWVSILFLPGTFLFWASTEMAVEIADDQK